MKTLLTILQIFARALALLAVSCVYMCIFTPLYMIAMATIGISFSDICDKWVRISNSLIRTYNEET